MQSGTIGLPSESLSTELGSYGWEVKLLFFLKLLS